MVIFGINLPQKGISPYSICTKFCLEEGVPGLHFHTKFDHCIFKNVALWSQKNAKNGNFW